jgi:hypothetical protein
MEIRDYKAGDEEHILKLFKSAFGKELSVDYWRWRFIENPVTQLMIKLMWDETRLVGHYAVSPLVLNVDGEKILTALSMTTMTDPEYAGKGIFTKLASELYLEEYKNHGLKSVWGFPNNNSHFAFINKLQWNDLEKIQTLSLSMEKIGGVALSSIKQANLFVQGHVKAFDQITVQQKIKVDRSLNYLNWRYLNNPSNAYMILEKEAGDINYYAVTKIFKSFSDQSKFEVDILELVFPEDNLQELMGTIKNIYKDFDVMQINVWLSPHDKRSKTLTQIGFLNTAHMTHMGVKIMDSKYEVLNNSNEWAYSMGDSDIY